MAFIIKDRVKEGTTSTGTGDITLSGSLATFDTFQSYMTNGDTTYYAIVHTSSGVDEWEVGLGTWNTGNTLTRTTVLAGSNGTSAEDFSAGSKDVFMTYPAAHAALAGDDVDFANITVSGTVDGRDVATDGTKLDTVEQNADVTDAINVAAAGALMRSGGTMTGALILNADPTTALGAATKEYVDTIAAAGIHYHTPVRVEAPLNLTVTYNNGTNGVGATLTNAGTQEAITIDGVALSSGDRVLVYEQTDATQNGIYTVTTVGSGSTNWVLTRATDADSYGASDPNALGEGDAYFVKEGATGAGELYVMNTAGTITFGTTDITFTVIAETAVYSAGTGLSLTGTTFAIGQDVGTTANVTFNQVTAAIIGNVTGNVTGDVTGNAGTATKLATARNIALSGDVTGNANFDGTGNISITAVVQDDSHSHVISNVDGLQTALDAKVPTSRTITAGAGLTGGGNLTANRTISHADTSTQASLTALTGAAVVSDIDVDTYGHVTNLATRNLTLANLGYTGETNATADQTITAGSGLSGGGTGDVTLSHADTSSQASVNNSNGTVIQDITLDTYGHITSLASVNLDGRYYTETEADSRFVNASGDTMTGSLTINTTGTALTIGGDGSLDSADASIYIGNAPSAYGFYFTYEGTGGGNTNALVISSTNSGSPKELLRSNQDGIVNLVQSNAKVAGNTIFHDGYHPNADKWTTARTLSLSGDATGSVSWDGSANATLSVTVADDSHTHSHLIAVDDRDMKPNTSGVGAGVKGIKAFFSSYGGMTGTDDTDYQDVLVLDTYSDASGGNANAITLDKSSSAMRIWNAAQGATSWGTPQRVFADNYHPNADKWTTARTLTLTGDVTGSVTWDGSGNASITTDWQGGQANTTLNMNNFSIINANNLTFGDPGPNEGITWNGGNGWHIYESPDDLTTNSGGNLQFVQGSTREMTLNTSGSLYTAAQGTLWGSSNDGSGSGLDADLLDGNHASAFAVASHTHDGRYYTETEADSRFVNASGDTITGRLKFNSAGSLFFETSVNGGYIPKPKGGHFVTNSNSYTGAIKIRMPVHGTADMISFHVDIFDYSTGESLTMFIAGYLYQATGSNEWVNLEVLTLTGNTSKDYTVRFGGDGSGNCVWIGETNSTWSYPQVLVRDVQVGYTADVDSWDDDWSISFATAFDTVNNTISNNLPLAKSAKSWTTARTLSLSGDASGSVSWDGSANATLSVTVADDSHNHVISNVDGLQTALNGKLSTSGKAADSDLLDGKNSSQSESVNTVAVRSSAGYLFSNYFNGSGTFSTTGLTSGMARFTGTNGTDTYGRSYTAAAARTLLNVEDGANNYSLPATPSVTGINIGSQVNLAESSDRADLLQITSSTGGWAGLQIRNSSNEGRWSFMTDGATAGFYDDENGDWAVQMIENGGVTLYHNNVANFTTGATYMEMGRHLDLNDYDIYGVDKIFHHGDTDTYMEFHEENQWRIVTGGAERLEVNNSQITSTEPIYAPSFHGDGSGLTNLPSGGAAFNDLTSKTSGTGDYRTTGRFLGEYALSQITTGVQNTAYGYYAGQRVRTGSNNAFFGHFAGRNQTVGKENVAVGSLALSQQYSSSYGNTAIGMAAMMNYGSNSETNWSRNTAVGWKSLTFAPPNTTSYTTAVGAEAMEHYLGGANSTAVGKGALRGTQYNASGDKNTAIGSHSMYLITTGYENVGVGAFTLSYCTGGDQNVAIGYSAMQDLTTGQLNTALGYKALENVTSGSKNVGIGPNALKNVTTGSSNIGIGGWGASASAYNPAYNITTQSNYGYFGSAQLSNLYTAVAWTVTSDPRDKEILGPVPIGMDFLRKIEPIAYKMKANREDTKGIDRTRYGFNAAEVLEAEGDDPVIIDKSDENKLRLTDGMIATVVVALKELDKKLNLLDEKLALLESKQ